MFSHRASIASALDSFRIDGRMLCYNSFVPKLYNWWSRWMMRPFSLVPPRPLQADGRLLPSGCLALTRYFCGASECSERGDAVLIALVGASANVAEAVRLRMDAHRQTTVLLSCRTPPKPTFAEHTQNVAPPPMP